MQGTESALHSQIETTPPSERVRVRRHADRAVYDRPQIAAILDEAMLCHVGFVHDGRPWVLPMAFGRIGDQLYVHGAAANRMLNSLNTGAPVCITVTLLDGLVMARSAFHHSVNYRSVVIAGTARLVEEPEEKTAALRAVTDHIIAGRWDEVRIPTPAETNATRVIAISWEEASAKIRVGPPIDSEADLSVPVWAGVIPVETRLGEPIPDAHVPEGVALHLARK